MATAMDSDVPVFLALMRELLRTGGSSRSPRHRVQLLTDGVDAMLAGAEWQPFAPLVLFLLGEDAKGAWSLTSAASAGLRREAARIAAADMVRQQFIQALGERLRASRVNLVLLKAAALSGWVYPAQAPRFGCDLDVLVRPEDKDRFTAALAGLAEQRSEFPGKPHLARLAYEWGFRTDLPVLTELDVHWALCYPALYPIDYPAMWARSRPHPAYGVEELRVLCPEDTLLHLALHALHDLRAWSRHDLDVALLLRAEAIDWDVLVARARSWGVAVAVYFLLERATRGLDACVPDTVLDALRPGSLLLGIGRWVLRPGGAQSHGARRPAHRPRQLVSQLAMSRSLWRAARFQLDYARARLADALRGTIGRY